MGIKISTGLAKAMLETKASVVADEYTDLTFATGSGSDNDTITTAAGDFTTDGYYPGMIITLHGCDPAGNDAVSTEILDITGSDAVIEVANGVVTAGGSGSGVAVISGVTLGGSIKERLNNGIIAFYSGSPPTTADAAETGTKLIEFTVDGGTFTASHPANGLELGTATLNVVVKSSSQTWKGTAIATGSAQYYRFYSNDFTTGSSTTAERLQGTVGVGTGDMRLSSTDITSGNTITLDSFSITLPLTA